MTARQKLEEFIIWTPYQKWFKHFYTELNPTPTTSEYYVSFDYIGIMPKGSEINCVKEIKKELIKRVKKLTNVEFEGEWRIKFKVGPMKCFFYLGSGSSGGPGCGTSGCM